MGASGSAWIKPRKRTGLRPDALKAVPHPRFLRPGQRFFRLQAGGGRRVTETLTHVPADEDWCAARPEDESRRIVRLKQSRLLAAADDGTGRHYRFIGYAPRSYDTHAYVAAVHESRLEIVCPEWHPSRTIAVGIDGVPEALRRPGAWLACRADLGATAAALVRPRRLSAPKAGLVPEDRYHLIAGDLAGARPAPWPSAGDPRAVVIYTSEIHARETRSGSREIHVVGHPPPVRRGDEVYVHYGERVQGRSTLERVRPTPNGTLLVLAPDWQAAPDIDVPSLPPASGVAGGAHGRQLWRILPAAAESEAPQNAR